ncbi:MAG: response regulator [Janthinobacterium lividum]|jgi:CheY-like chemotaxis protein
MSFANLVPSPAVVAGKIPATKLNPASGLAAANAVGVSSPATKGPNLVYVVENDYISSVITELIVKKNLLSSEVRCYANGQWAFDDLLLTLRDGGTLPDLVVLDLDMPLMDGWEFLDALANLASAQSIRVFVQTSSIQPDDRAKALSYKQVRGFFSKPLKEDGVAAMLSLLQYAREVG